MAQRPEVVHNDPSQPAPTKAKRKRSPSVAKPAFFVIQILGENGEPVAFDKKHIKLLAVERSAENVMELMENGSHPHAFYLRGIVPVARTGAQRTAPAAPQAAA
jgi:hypothetical protein